MKNRFLLLAALSLLVAPAYGAGGETASVVDFKVAQDQGFVRVEITLSRPVTPMLKTTDAPERLVMVLPGAITDARQKRIPVGASGIKGVRMGLHSTQPPETDVVVDFEDGPSHSHALRVEGNKIVLAVAMASSSRRSAPAGGNVSPVIGIFQRHAPDASASTNAAAPARVASTVSRPAASAPPLASAPASQTVATEPPAPVAAPQVAASAGQRQGPPASVSAPQSAAPAGQTEVAETAPSTKPKPVQMAAAQPPLPNQATVDSANAVPPQLTMRTPESDLRVGFNIKYVAQGAAYLDGGHSAGLSEGMKLEITDQQKDTSAGGGAPGGKVVAAELEVVSVAETSAVTEIKNQTRDIKPGEVAYLSAADQASLVAQRTLSSTRKYPQVVTFTEGDPLDEEARAEVPRPPLPEVNRARGRLGFDYGGIHTQGLNSNQVGMVLRADVTRIGGTYWNLSGFWRGRLQTQASNFAPTVQDLINRTYTISMSYDNPNSAWVGGFGRLYLPWAPSLDTIDGGYFGRKLHEGVTAGFFGGSQPDPTSWNYSPGRRVLGTFINFQGGDFDGFRYSSTVGGGESTVYGQFDRPLAFAETGLFYKRYFSVYDTMQVDSPPVVQQSGVTAPGWGLARSFLTFRVQPIERLSFDLNHNYFRDVPTFNTSLIGTGLLDKYLFQGFSVGVRGEIIRHVTLYTTLGRSNRSGDARASLNQLYGIAFDRIWRTGIRADLHYSKFNGSFGSGQYESISLSRNFTDRFRLEVLGGRQVFASALTTNNNAKFVTGMMDMNLGAKYFLGAGLTVQRGSMQSYDQWFTMLGYRFDNRNSHSR